MTEELPFKKVTLANVLTATLVVTAIQLVALLITYRNLPVLITAPPSFSPAGPSPEGSVINSILLVGFAFGATLVFLWVLRRKMVRYFKVLVFASISFSAFLLTLITTDSFTFNNVPLEWELPIDVIVAVLVVTLIGYTIFVENHPVLSTVTLGFVGAEVGSFFASTLPLWTALVLPLAFSLYDMYAVFKGPLKQLIGLAPTVALAGMSIKLGEFTLGMGDVVFYTMLPSFALYHTVVAPVLAGAAPLFTILAIDVGVIATLALLTKVRLLPGLPIPMLLGVSTLLVYLA